MHLAAGQGDRLGDRRILEHVSEPVLARAESRLHLLALGDVPGDREDAGLAVDVDDARRHQTCAHRAVLAAEAHLQVADHTGGLQRCYEPLPILGGGPDLQLVGGPALDVVAREAGGLREAVADVQIQTVGEPVQVDGVGGGVKRRLELGLGRLERALDAPALADVTHGEYPAGQPPLRVAHGPAADLDGDDAAVRAKPAVLDRPQGFALPRAGQVRDGALPVFGSDQLEDRPTDQCLLALVPEHAQTRRGEAAQVAVRIGDAQGVR